MLDLYLALAVDTNGPREPDDDLPEPSTRITESIETVDNDFVGRLLGSLTI